MPETTPKPEEENNSYYLRALPDPAICQTCPIGEINSFATCLVEFPITCKYAMSYGKAYLCRHPNWVKFVQP